MEGVYNKDNLFAEFKMQKTNNRVFVVMGDGEINEGSVWEASMAAPHFKLNNLIAIIDRNNLDPKLIDEVILGCANQAGEDNRNVARSSLKTSPKNRTRKKDKVALYASCKN